MSPVFLFILLLILSFGALLYLLRPTRSEVAVERHLAGIEESRVVGDGGMNILKKKRSSSMPWLDDIVLELPGALFLSRLITQSGVTWQLSSLVVFVFVAALIVWWIASFAGSSIVLSAGIGVAISCAPLVYLYVLREIRFKRFDSLLPEAVDLMARGLRAGHAISAVLEMVGNEIDEPVGSEFRTLAEEQSLGIPMREAMLGLVERIPRDDVRFLATAILLQKETGGNLALILDKTAAVMRERARLRGQLMIYTAQGRITGWILCFAPFIMFGIISLVNHDYEKALFTDPTGLHMVYGGLVMMILGVLVIRKIVDIKV